MVSLFLLTLSFTTILSMDHDRVEESSVDAYGMPHTDVQAGAVVTGTIHDDDIHEDGEGEDRFQLLRDKLQELGRNERKKIKKFIGHQLYKLTLLQFKTKEDLELKQQKIRIFLEIDRKNRMAKLRFVDGDALTGYHERKQAIENAYEFEMQQKSEDFEKSQAELDLKFLGEVNKLMKHVEQNIISLFGKRSEFVVHYKKQKKEIEEEMHDELASLRQTVVEQADQEQIQKVVNELREYIERTGRPPIKVIGVIDDNLYKPFINYAKEVDYHGKKSDKVLKVHCSKLLDDEETTKKCRKIRAAMFWMSAEHIMELYRMHKKLKHQK